MSLPPWHETAVDRKHRRKEFDCGDGELNEYLQRYARQNHQNGVANAYVAALNEDPAKVIGYYTTTMAEIACDHVPQNIIKPVGQYPIPCVRLGRLAVDTGWQGMSLGGRLLLNAGERAVEAAQHAATRCVLIDAKNDRVAKYYESFGAVRLADHSLTLVWPLGTIRAALEDLKQRAQSAQS